MLLVVGLKPNRIESNAARRYFHWLQHNGTNVQFADSSAGQFRVKANDKTYHIDGIVRKDGKIVEAVEFLGKSRIKSNELCASIFMLLVAWVLGVFPGQSRTTDHVQRCHS